MSDQGLFYQKTKKLIQLIDSLKDLNLDQYIPLHKIAVVGGQSSGKSSVLEQIAGFDFLPKKSGLCTRVPIEIRLINKNIPNPYCVFKESKFNQQIKLEDMTLIKDQIETITDKIAGVNQNIVNKPIVLTIFSNNVPNLTLIDLPGITRVPLQGSDQKQDIEKITKGIIQDNINDEMCIILVVTSANQDITVSDGLQMAKQYDPNGIRTIGVLTKIDIMDKGTNAKDILENKIVSLKLGFFGIKCRSQYEIDNKTNIQQSLDNENQYFTSHPIYQNQLEQCGTTNLVQKLIQVLYQSIKKHIPKLRQQISALLNSKKAELQKLGPIIPQNKQQKHLYLFTQITKFSDYLKKEFKGEYFEFNLKSQSKIFSMMKELFKKELQQIDVYSNEEIQKALIQYEGNSIPGFPSIDAFLYLLTPLLRQLEQPALDLVDNLQIYIKDVINQLTLKIIGNQKLQHIIIDHCNKILINQKNHCINIVQCLLQAEIGYVYTNEFWQGNTIKSSNNPLIDEMRYRIVNYYQYSLKTCRDNISRQIGYIMIDQLVLEVQKQLQYSSKDIDINETPETIQQQQQIKQQIEVLEYSSNLIIRELGEIRIEEQQFDHIQIQPDSSSQIQEQNTPDTNRKSQNLYFSNVSNDQNQEQKQFTPSQSQMIDNFYKDPLFKTENSKQSEIQSTQQNPQKKQNLISNLFGTNPVDSAKQQVTNQAAKQANQEVQKQLGNNAVSKQVGNQVEKQVKKKNWWE